MKDIKSIQFPDTKLSDLSKQVCQYLRTMGVSVKEQNNVLALSWDSSILNYSLEQSEHITRFAIWIKGSKRFVDVFHYAGRKANFAILITADKLR